MSTPQGTLLVIGSGPGIGVSTASLFATHGFKHIILTSRNAERLTQEAETVKKAAGAQGEIRVDTLTLDLAGSKDSLNETFGKVDGLLKESGSELEVVLYNGARVGPSVIGEWDVSGLEEDLRITTISLYTTLNWAVPHLLKASSTSNLNPAFLVTSGGLYKEPYPFLFSLSVGKAAQHNLIESYHRKFEPKIHVALVPISGMVKDDSKVTTPKAVAETFWELYGQKKGAGGKLQIEMEDPDYYAGVEAFRKHIEGE